MIYDDYDIAGHGVRIRGRCVAMESLPGFGVFRAPEPLREADLLVDFFSECDISEHIAAAESVPVLCDIVFRGTRSRFFADDRMVCFLMDRCGGPVVGWYHERGGSMFASNVAAASEPDPSLLRFMLWMAYGVAAAPFSTVAVHASCVVRGGRAVLFLGESGTGKSTHARLWCESVEGAHLLNDDSPIVRVSEGSVAVYGSPWSGKTPCYRNESYPLAGVVRLRQAPHNRMARLDRLSGFAALHPSCPPEFSRDEPLAGAVCSVLSDVLRSVPVWSLECLPDASAARLANETIFGL